MKPELLALTQDQAEYRLTANHPLRIAGAAGRQIECLSGTAWITAYGEYTDFMLRQGQRFEVPNDGLMLIDAAGAGTVHVRLPADTKVPHGWAALQRKFASTLQSVGFLLRN
ncbi:DUF2917 domain-containing protein [Rugamonas aquatica]|uniref:DUF2917 domain-containing protein n=1 Tax=Rugamonas aquatica TaxID=2743357 RepID=A0A6A7N1L3_9BURK|nr:DUF2917 domain-containing protein [Rugamonas aquatica]MQA38810.1 DUF2917 domain-containing protein [Rugamonas aquatica]